MAGAETLNDVTALSQHWSLNTSYKIHEWGITQN